MSNEEKRKVLLELLYGAQNALIGAELDLADFVTLAGDQNARANVLDRLKVLVCNRNGGRNINIDTLITRVNAGDYDDKETIVK